MRVSIRSFAVVDERGREEAIEVEEEELVRWMGMDCFNGLMGPMLDVVGVSA
ncbi:hypothetical protein C5167_042861 [Papaver somniferum]|uniref:Uncharacterized protein n=1 Tax=Papaver somniferum TaxID=3469 RepID=A0A4Y7L7X6_PAPSO|nr:hypothetical protein C5167_042861 [Papaver somniferum]